MSLREEREDSVVRVRIRRKLQQSHRLKLVVANYVIKYDFISFLEMFIKTILFDHIFDGAAW